MSIESMPQMQQTNNVAQFPAWEPMVARFEPALTNEQKAQFIKGVWDFVTIQMNQMIKREKEIIRKRREDERRNGR